MIQDKCKKLVSHLSGPLKDVDSWEIFHKQVVFICPKFALAREL